MSGNLTVEPAAINLWLLVVALGIDAALGYPDLLYRLIRHPVVWFGTIVTILDRALNNPAWRIGQRRVAGLAALLVLLALVGSISIAVSTALRSLPYGWLAEALLAGSLLAQRSLHAHVTAVAKGLEQDGLAGGRKAVALIVGRDPESLDEHGVARAGIESLAENFSDGVVAPALWLAIGGLPGIALYKAVNTADSMIGHQSDKYHAFGWATARLDDLVNLPASRLAALLLILAAWLTTGASAHEAFTGVERDAGKHRSPNAGWPEAALAGALALKLAGPRRYGESWVEDRWMGNGRENADAGDIRRALKLYRTACILLFAAVVLLAIGLTR